MNARPAAQPTLRLPDGRHVLASTPQSAAVLWREITGPGLYRDAADTLGPGALVVDVGANIGLASIYFADRCPGVRIVAAEPEPGSFRCLRENLARYVPTARAVPIAVADRAGQRELTHYPNSPEQTTLYPDEDDQRHTGSIVLGMAGLDNRTRTDVLARMLVAERCLVPVTTVADLLAEHVGGGPVDLLKIDVERGELAVLRGIGPADWDRIGAVAVEVHDLAGGLRAVTDLLGRHGFAVTVGQAPQFAGTSVYDVLGRRP